MMRILPAFAALCVASVAYAQPQAEFFLSSNSDDPSATGELMVNLGDDFSLFLFANPADGVRINSTITDITTSTAGVLSATGTSVENPNFGFSGNRFDGEPAAGALNTNDLLIEGVGGIAVTALGIFDDLIGADPTESGGSFRLAELNFNAAAAGTTTIGAAANGANPITGVGLGGLEVLFGSLDVTVIDPNAGGDPILGATPVSDPIDLTAVFGAGGGTLADAVALANTGDGDFASLGVIGVSIENESTDGLFSAALNGESVDVSIDGALATTLPVGVQTADLVISSDFGDFRFGISANVPEPGAFGLASLAVIGLAGLRRRV